MKEALLAAIRFYRKWISPALPDSCRFVPTCSGYAMEAVERFGPLKGAALAVGRLLRCQPLCRGGHDPVPSKESRTQNQPPTPFVSGRCATRDRTAGPRGPRG